MQTRPLPVTHHKPEFDILMEVNAYLEPAMDCRKLRHAAGFKLLQ